MSRLFVAIRALFFAACFFTLWAWLALVVEGYDARLQARLPGWATLPGLALMSVGAALAVSCVALFVGKGQGTPAPFDPPRRFVAVGPYRYVRNPMYVGGFTLLLGWALYRNSISLLIFSCAFVLLFHLFVIGYEERALREKFGSEYERYLATVPRWLPLSATRSRETRPAR
jgi:protein-S-isoprenylcysteine O-methyltransferase Ste14